MNFLVRIRSLPNSLVKQFAKWSTQMRRTPAAHWIDTNYIHSHPYFHCHHSSPKKLPRSKIEAIAKKCRERNATLSFDDGVRGFQLVNGLLFLGSKKNGNYETRIQLCPRNLDGTSFRAIGRGSPFARGPLEFTGRLMAPLEIGRLLNTQQEMN